LLERREDLAAGQQRRASAGGGEAFGDHSARNAKLQSLEVLDRSDRLLRVDDVRTVVDTVDVVQALLGVDLARHLQAVTAVEEDVPLVRVAQPQQVGAEEGGGADLADAVD